MSKSNQGQQNIYLSINAIDDFSGNTANITTLTCNTITTQNLISTVNYVTNETVYNDLNVNNNVIIDGSLDCDVIDASGNLSLMIDGAEELNINSTTIDFKSNDVVGIQDCSINGILFVNTVSVTEAIVLNELFFNNYIQSDNGYISLTNGYVNSKDLIIDTNLIKTDSLNNYVGINKTTPTVALDIVGGCNVTGTINCNNLSSNELLIDTDGVWYNPANMALSIGGLNTPSGALSVCQKYFGPSTEIGLHLGVISSINPILELVAGTNGICQLLFSNVGASDGLISYSTQYNTMSFYVNNLIQMVMSDNLIDFQDCDIITTGNINCNDLIVDTNLIKTDSSNNFVGINKTTPTVALDVVGDTRLYGKSNTRNLFVNETSTTLGTEIGMNVGIGGGINTAVNCIAAVGGLSRFDFLESGNTNYKGRILFDNSSSTLTISTASGAQLSLDSNLINLYNNDLNSTGNIDVSGNINCDGNSTSATMTCTSGNVDNNLIVIGNTTTGTLTTDGDGTIYGVLTANSLFTSGNIDTSGNIVSTGDVNIHGGAVIYGTIPSTRTTNGIYCGDTGAGYSSIEMVGTTGSFIDFTDNVTDYYARLICTNSTGTIKIATSSGGDQFVISNSTIDCKDNLITTTGNISGNLNSTRGQLLTCHGEHNGVMNTTTNAGFQLCKMGNGAANDSNSGLLFGVQSIKLKQFIYSSALGSGPTTSTRICFEVFADSVSICYAWIDYSDTTNGSVAMHRFCNKFSSSSTSQVDVYPVVTKTWGACLSFKNITLTSIGTDTKNVISVVVESQDDL